MRIYKHARAIRALLLTLFIFAAIPLFFKGYGASNDKYYARVDFIVESEITQKIMLKENTIREIEAPPSPTGYQLSYMEISSNTGFPKTIVPILYDKKSEINGKVFSLLSYNGSIKLSTSISSGNLTFLATIKTVYVKRTWLPIMDRNIEILVESPEPPFSLKNLTLKISVDNFAPYEIVDVISPDGKHLVRPEIQEKYPPQAIGFDLKHVSLSFKYGLKTGKYKILFRMVDRKLPNAFIICEETFFNDTVAPRSEKAFSVKDKNGLQHLGYIVIVYSLVPEYMNSYGNVYINATLMDYVHLEHKTITVGSITYLIPPIEFEFWTKAFVVFGSWFKIKNDYKYPINVLYIPVSFKEAGKWTPQGLEVEINDLDLKGYLFAYIVVQLPAYGHIREIVTPNGEILSIYKNSKLSWGGVKRSLSVLDDEAYIQVKYNNISDPGLYTVNISWDPLYIKTVDSKDRVLSNVELRAEGIDTIFLTNESGWGILKVYKPGIINITATYKGKTVQELQIKTLISHQIVLRCKVYDLKVTVQTMLNQGLSDAEVTLIDKDTGEVFETAITDKNGETIFIQIPHGEYKVQGSYKRISNSMKVNMDDNKEILLKLNIVLIIPFFNMPLTLEETAGISLAFTSILLATKFMRKRKIEDYDEEDAEN